jgi:hypothetical protein
VCDSFAGLAPSVRAYGTKQRRDARGALEADRIIPSLAKPKRRNGGMTTAKKSPKLLRRLRPAGARARRQIYLKMPLHDALAAEEKRLAS